MRLPGLVRIDVVSFRSNLFYRVDLHELRPIVQELDGVIVDLCLATLRFEFLDFSFG